MRALVLFALGLGLITTIACSAPAPSQSAGGARPGSSGDLKSVSEPAGRPAAPALQEAARNSSSSGAATTSSQVDAAIPRLDRMVIANVNLHLSAENAVTAARDAERIALRYGGFVGSSNVKDLETGRDATMTLRVPGASFSDALDELRGLGKKVNDESRSTEDVTEEFTDVESNVRNLRATEARILGLMERASKMEEILVLQRELTNIRGQVEKLEGRRRVLESRSSYANITLRITEAISVAPKSQQTLADTAAQALGVLARFGQLLATLLIWVVVFSPIWGIPVGLGWWFARQRPARSSAPDAANAG